jgi:type IV secretory pathway VirB10-like protein
MKDLPMSNDLETKIRSALEKGKPLFEALIADLEREATLIKERDLDPRKLADEPRIQEARSGAVDALEQLTSFAKTLDSLVKSYAEDLENRVDVDKIKDQIASAPAAGRSLIDDHNGHATADRIKVAGEDAKAKVVSEADRGKESVQAAAHKGKEDAQAAAQKAKEEAQAAAVKAKDSTKEMLAALGWLAAAGTVIYVVFFDEKRRRQAKSVAKGAASGLIVVANSASKKS